MFHSTKFIAVLGVWAMKWVFFITAFTGPISIGILWGDRLPVEVGGLYVTAWMAFCIGVGALLDKLDDIHKTLKDNKSSEPPSE